MINWASFQTNLSTLFTAQQFQTIAETAEAIAMQYHLAMISASTLLGNMLSGGANIDALRIALISGFSMQLNSPAPLGIAPYTVMAGGFVAYWATATFNPLPPNPPAIAPTTGIQLLVPGLPTPLNTLLFTAFNSGIAIPDPVTAASTLVSLLMSALVSHLATISGIYNGLIASPTGPIPGPPIPWVGII
jgi:hypothetical protein